MNSLYGLAFLSVLLGIFIYVYIPESFPSLIEKPDDSYDFIVVGGGTAGSLIAARLSENAQFKVLLVEAGKDDYGEEMISVPTKNFGLFRGEWDWNYFTEPQHNACLALVENMSFWSRAKVLGGCSAHNMLIYMRGHAEDYNRWSEKGCKGWSYEEVWPYFKKSERNVGEREELCKGIYADSHGCSGQLPVSDTCCEKGAHVIMEAAKELGHKILPDLNLGDCFGFGPIQISTEKGVRATSSSAFLRPAMRRSNLHVLLNTHVEKLLFEGKRATGVLINTRGKKSRLRVKNEVIMTSGTIGSPHTLLLSGIGPKNDLEQLGIDVIADLPVGKNLQDHIFSDFVYYVNSTRIHSFSERNSLWQEIQYKLFKTGFIGKGLGEVSGFLNVVDKKSMFPETQIIYAPALLCGPASPHNFCSKVLNMKDNFINGFYASDNPDGLSTKRGITLFAQLSHPKSVGYLKLRSKDPQDHPIINPNYLSDPYDVAVLKEGLKFLASFENTTALKRLGAESKLRTVPHPTCGMFPIMSDEFAECYVRHHTMTVYHPVGTCKMGAVCDPTTVVDPELKVKGIEGLRVADASVIPYVVSGNTNAPATMIGEKCADMVLQSWK